MSTALAIAGLVALLLLVAMAIAGIRRIGGPAARRSAAIGERERAMRAQAEIEEHDIEQMIEARNELRRRTGRRSIGDELADEALRRSPDESD